MNIVTEKIKVKRVPKRGHYDFKTICKILDKEFLCHIGFVHQQLPVVIPTLYGRSGEYVYIHGAASSRMINQLEKGVDVCLTVTRINGLVLARSAFHHSINYESVVLFGKAYVVSPSEREAALKVLSDQVLKDRWEEVRAPNDKELKATKVLKLKIDQASAKIRTGGPVDEKADYQLDIWAGEVPVEMKYGDPVEDRDLIERKLPKSVERLYSGI